MPSHETHVQPPYFRSSCHCLIAGTILLVSLGLAGQLSAGQEPVLRLGDNQIENGTFDQQAERNLPAHWTVTGEVEQIATRPDPHNPLGGALRIVTRGQGSVTLSQTINADGPADFFCSAWIQGHGKAVVRAGQLSMSYHGQAERQRVAGLTRLENTGPLSVTFTLSSLDGKSASFVIQDVRLQPVQSVADELPRRSASSRTALIDRGVAEAMIVVPHDDPQASQWAVAINAVIEQRIGAALPVLTDLEATQSGAPELVPDQVDRHLILIGRLGTNRAICPAYNRFLAAADGYYPGGDGYVVRTCVNVMRNGRNHLLLGGSTQEGVARAVQRFIELLKQTPVDNESLVLPWTLDVQLGGDCRQVMTQRDELWQRDPENSLLPPVQPGYGTIRRWYENAMGYYWTGWESYRQRAATMLDQVIADSADTHHYLVEFFVRTYDMLDDSGVFTVEQCRAVDQLLLKNFLHMTTGPDVSWMGVFSPPYDQVQLTNRHQIAPWTADLALADFLGDYFQWDGDLAAVVEFRRSEKDAFMRHWLGHRWGVSMPGAGTTEHEEEIVAAMYRYALHHELYDFFESGRAEKALALAKIDHLTGMCMRPGGLIDYPLILGILAHYNHDGRYRALRDTLPYSEPAMGPFQGRYVAGIHRYSPGPELPAAKPDELAGLTAPAMDPHRLRHLNELANKRFLVPSLPVDDVVDFASFRGGFQPQDDLLMLNGIASYALPGAILNFSSHGYRWLAGSAESADAEAYYNNNAVHVLRTDRWMDSSPPYSAVARRDWLVNWEGGGVAAITLDPFVGMRWQRQVIWVADGLFVVRDKLTAREDGTYQVSVNWFPSNPSAWNDGVMLCTWGEAHFRLTPLGDAFTVIHSGDDTSSQPVLRQMSYRSMRQGESLIATTVLQAYNEEQETALFPVLSADGDVLVMRSRDHDHDAEPIAVHWQPRAGIDLGVIIAGQLYEIEADKLTTSPLPSETMDQLLSQVDQPSEHMAQEPAANDQIQITDAMAQWHQTWVYEGLRSSARVIPDRQLAGGIVDFGRTIALDKVAAQQSGGPWRANALPEKIFVTPGDADGNVPSQDSPLWHELDGQRQWKPGARTGNYGESAPVEQHHEFVEAGGIPVRYLRADSTSGLAYYDRNTFADNRLFDITSVDFDGDGIAELFVSPVIYPKFVRRGQWTNDTFAVLNQDGTLRWQHSARTNYQAVRALDYLGLGHPQVVTVSIDGRIEVFDANGALLREIDLYDAHQQYNQQYGHTNTRQPAGGFVMPYSIGLWRLTPQQPAGLIVSRYGWFSFIDHDGRFDGLLTAGSYVMPRLLAEPLDFNGDGTLEQLCLSSGRIWKVSGPRDERIPQPGGYYYYPQVYHTQGVEEPVSMPMSVEGPRVFTMQSLALAGGNRYVLVARSNYLGIYDARTNQWCFTWIPLVEITASTVVRDTDDSCIALAVTRDRMLWQLEWNSDPSRLSAHRADSFPDDLRGMAPMKEPGNALLCGTKGLHVRMQDGTLIQIADGPFANVIDNQTNVVAVRDDGSVIQLTPTGDIK
ncbi:MAG: hypothetical protein IT445_19260 [Phycisphaeraceae bacterium]|nr:hypothetical protein [Phycisphaeraceae bacterium]